MRNAKILIVEDEQLVASDLQSRILKMGYKASATAATSEEAFSLAESIRPDLILTDIRLGPGPDGIELAASIKARYDVPIIFLTAYSDDETLSRAQLTAPYAYVIKPFQDRELQIAIEIALYRHRIELELRENRNWLSAILESMADAVIATNVDNRVVFLNPTAELLTGWSEKEAINKVLNEVFDLTMREVFLSPWSRFPRDPAGKVSPVESVLLSRQGKVHSIELNSSPMNDDNGKEVGKVLVFRSVAGYDVSQTRPAL